MLCDYVYNQFFAYLHACHKLGLVDLLANNIMLRNENLCMNKYIYYRVIISGLKRRQSSHGCWMMKAEPYLGPSVPPGRGGGPGRIGGPMRGFKGPIAIDANK